MTEKNTYKKQRGTAAKSNGQPKPLDGSKKVKKRNQVGQTDGEG